MKRRFKLYLTLVLLLMPLLGIAQNNPQSRPDNRFVIAYGNTNHGEQDDVLMFIPVEYCEFVYNRLPKTTRMELDSISMESTDYPDTVIESIKRYAGAVIVPAHGDIDRDDALYPVALFADKYGLICRGLIEHAIIIYDIKAQKYRNYKVVSNTQTETDENAFGEDMYINVKAYWYDTISFDEPCIYVGKVKAKYL